MAFRTFIKLFFAVPLAALCVYVLGSVVGLI